MVVAAPTVIVVAGTEIFVARRGRAPRRKVLDSPVQDVPGLLAEVRLALGTRRRWQWLRSPVRIAVPTLFCQERVVEGLPSFADPALYARAVRANATRYFVIDGPPPAVGVGRVPEHGLPTVCIADLSLVTGLATLCKQAGVHFEGLFPVSSSGGSLADHEEIVLHLLGPNWRRLPRVTLQDVTDERTASGRRLLLPATASAVAAVMLWHVTRPALVSNSLVSSSYRDTAARSAAVRQSPVSLEAWHEAGGSLRDLHAIVQALPEEATLQRISIDSGEVSVSISARDPVKVVSQLSGLPSFEPAELSGPPSRDWSASADSAARITVRLVRRRRG